MRLNWDKALHSSNSGFYFINFQLKHITPVASEDQNQAQPYDKPGHVKGEDTAEDARHRVIRFGRRGGLGGNYGLLIGLGW